MKTTRKFSGVLGNLVYSFAHNLGYDPNYVQATALSADAGGLDPGGVPGNAYWVGHDATNITINYYNQPATGTNNIVFSIEALVITYFDGDGNPLCGQNSKC